MERKCVYAQVLGVYLSQEKKQSMIYMTEKQVDNHLGKRGEENP